jgi:hypothetical protein
MSRAVLAIALLAGLSATSAGAADEMPAPSYQKHVTALFSRMGCNGGTCHGAVKGQNGFRLSLFAADPAGDHERILKEFGGRRLNVGQPASSLLLQKATGQADHGGGVRVRPGSPEYSVLSRWIAAGAPLDEAVRLDRLEVTPAERTAQVGQRYQLGVKARFADGTSEDVTAYCSFESLDSAVAQVDAGGLVAPKGVGDAALIVRYRAHPAVARIIIPRPGTGPFPAVEPNNFIDTHVLAKLRQLNLPPAALADDATFLRRVSLDVTGALPSPEEVRAFLTDPSPNKRSKKIDELLARPGHAALWALKFCDLLKAADYGVYADALSQEADAPRFQEWVRARLSENVPYDEFVERILLATSREGRSVEEYAAEVKAMMEGFAPGRPDLSLYARRKTLDLFWQRRGADGVGGTMQVAHAFLGLRLECAQCHRHPHDVWTQDDLLEFANFFMRVRRVGFEGDNEKRYPDMAAVKKRFDREAKWLDAAIKQQKEREGKVLDDEAKQAKTEADKLTAEIARLEKARATPDEIALKRKELAAAKAVMGKVDAFRQTMAEKEKRARVLPEIGRRLLQAEVRLLKPGTPARVTSPLGTKESRTFRLLGAPAPSDIAPEADPREQVMAWMRKPDNPYFARAIVNRVWAHYMGRGLIDPPDNLSAFNPPSHPKLLDDLCKGFIENKYDLRWLHRTILNSRTYQQDSTPAAGAAADRTNYASAPLRRLPAEVLMDALDTATGTTEKMDMKFYHWPDEIKTVEVPFPPRNPFVSFVLETYGRPRRNAAVQCDCERDGSASVFQVLALANHPHVWEKIRDPNGRAAKLAKAPGDEGSKVDELFLAALGRLSDAGERRDAIGYVKAAESLEKGLQGVLWGLLNTREFLLQH